MTAATEKVLLHMCCGPCAIYPVKVLRKHGYELMGYFHRQNIHPYTECQQREATLMAFAEAEKIRVLHEPGYDIETFLQNVAFREQNRCLYCYHARLKAAAHIARRGRFHGFTTTLLYSKFQRHEEIRSIGDAIGRKMGIPFLYFDFRTGWKEGIAASKARGMYRQQYCGCIFSERDRYVKKESKISA
jgi:predicted adenine nucleotide alpha hydrolase (AANH) superfamily ATPase